MEGELCIRFFEVGDQEQARWLILEGLGEHFGYIDETLNPDLDDILHNYIIPGHVFMIACMGREMVGTGALIFHGEEISEMVRISTRKEYRRRGIGRAIITSLVNVARQRGDQRIIVKTNASWHDAINLYKRLGFVESGRTALGVSLELLLAAPEPGAEADRHHHQAWRPPRKDDWNRRTLCLAGIVRDCGRNRQKSTQKASILTAIVARYLKRKCLLQTGVQECRCGLIPDGCPTSFVWIFSALLGSFLCIRMRRKN